MCVGGGGGCWRINSFRHQCYEREDSAAINIVFLVPASASQLVVCDNMSVRFLAAN